MRGAMFRHGPTALLILMVLGDASVALARPPLAVAKVAPAGPQQHHAGASPGSTRLVHRPAQVTYVEIPAVFSEYVRDGYERVPNSRPTMNVKLHGPLSTVSKLGDDEKEYPVTNYVDLQVLSGPVQVERGGHRIMQPVAFHLSLADYQKRFDGRRNAVPVLVIKRKGRFEEVDPFADVDEAKKMKGFPLDRHLSRSHGEQSGGNFFFEL